MADFIKTITNSIDVFCMEPTTKWGDTFGAPYTMVWGVAQWGSEGNTIIFDFQKLISESVTPSWDKSQNLIQKLISESVSPIMESNLESLRSGIWDVVFPSNTINAEDRDVASYTSGSASTLSFTCQAAASTVWS